jgi:predicted dehydrogenase
VADNYSWYPPIRAAGDLVAAGKIGTPVALRARTMGGLGTAPGYVEPHTPDDWREHKSKNGGFVYDDVVHYWTVARFLMGAEVESVSAMLANTEATYEGPGVVSWRHEGGEKFGSLTYGNSSKRRTSIPIKTRYYASAEDFEVVGTDGMLWVRRLAGELRQEPALMLCRDGSTQSWETIETDYGAGFRDNIHDIIGSLTSGKDPSLNPEEGRAQIQFAWAVYRAAREKRTVALGEITAG